MNGKAARNLRNLVADNMGHLPMVNYQDIPKGIKLYPSGVNSDGSTRYQSVEVSVRVLNECQRALYQRAKRLHHHF